MTASNKLLRNVHENCPSLLLIEDTVGCSGRPLLYSFIKRAQTNGYDVKYLQYDCSRFSDSQTLRELGVTQIPVHQHNQTPEGLESRPCDTLSHNLSTFSGKTVVVLDSITTLSLFENPTEICTALRKKEQQIKEDNQEMRVIALLHSDVHSEDELKKLRYVFPCMLKVSTSQLAGKLLCKGMWRKPGGKVLEKEELFELDSHYTLTRVEDSASRTSGCAQVVKDTAQQKSVPSTTFRLGLTASEEKARSEVVLPFANKRSTGGTGQVIYEAEDVDWDEEDPDDDLDI